MEKFEKPITMVLVVLLLGYLIYANSACCGNAQSDQASGITIATPPQKAEFHFGTANEPVPFNFAKPKEIEVEVVLDSTAVVDTVVVQLEEQ